MNRSHLHTFHIPVMGLCFTLDTPLKVARFGISSVVSIVEDTIIEELRHYYSNLYNEPYVQITQKEDDFRAKRITAYLNLLNKIVQQQVETLRNLPFEEGSELVKYFELLPDLSPVRVQYEQMLQTTDVTKKEVLQKELRTKVQAGAIDANIMSKLDRTHYNDAGEALPKEFNDALAALRGFANSTLNSSVIFSAGYNPRLYSYVEEFKDFYPNAAQKLNKHIILKVSDYRSALTQGKIMAKKGIWISEFRIESGLNCGGHAFATDGLLLGPIMEEFKNNKPALIQELLPIYNAALVERGYTPFEQAPETRITVQGGIGTAKENEFMLNHYQTDGTGWGSPFLLVPEVTTLDEETRNALSVAKKEDYYLSNTSPLGVPFNFFRNTSAERERQEELAKNKPGNICTKKCLVSSTEYSEVPICTASIKYQTTKIKELKALALSEEQYKLEYDRITEKDCLCEGLSSAAEYSYHIKPLIRKKSHGVVVCPGPNLAYFSGILSLRQMVDHIYGRFNALNSVKRSNIFVNELEMYVDYLRKELVKHAGTIEMSKKRYLNTFHTNLLKGIEYYHTLTGQMKNETDKYIKEMREELVQIELMLKQFSIPSLEA